MFGHIFLIALGIFFVGGLIVGIFWVKNDPMEKHDHAEDPAEYEEYEPTAQQKLEMNAAYGQDLDTITRMTRIDWITMLELRRARLRAECPHLYADDWYDTSRREFSAWAVEQAQIQARFVKRYTRAA